MKPSYEQLEQRLRDAQNRIADLTGVHLAGAVRGVIRIEPRPARVLAMLYASPGIVSVGLLWSEVFADEATGDGPCMESVKVAVSKARAALRAAGLSGETVKNDFGYGYRLNAEARAWLSARLQPLEIAA